VHGVVPPQVQDPALALVELHQVLLCPSPAYPSPGYWNCSLQAKQLGQTVNPLDCCDFGLMFFFFAKMSVAAFLFVFLHEKLVCTYFSWVWRSLASVVWSNNFTCWRGTCHSARGTFSLSKWSNSGASCAFEGCVLSRTAMVFSPGRVVCGEEAPLLADFILLYIRIHSYKASKLQRTKLNLSCS